MDNTYDDFDAAVFLTSLSLDGSDADARPTVVELACLSTWPAGSKGDTSERDLIATLLLLCRRFGFGRVPQLAAAIEEIWRDPEAINKHRAQREAHFRSMRWLEAEPLERQFDGVTFGNENQMIGRCKYCGASDVVAFDHAKACREPRPDALP